MNSKMTSKENYIQIAINIDEVRNFYLTIAELLNNRMGACKTNEARTKEGIIQHAVLHAMQVHMGPRLGEENMEHVNKLALDIVSLISIEKNLSPE